MSQITHYAFLALCEIHGVMSPDCSNPLSVLAVTVVVPLLDIPPPIDLDVLLATRVLVILSVLPFET